MNLPFDPAEVSRRLLVWYGKEGRDLPWRNTRDPYRIWLSEIMLVMRTLSMGLYLLPVIVGTMSQRVLLLFWILMPASRIMPLILQPM